MNKNYSLPAKLFFLFIIVPILLLVLFRQYKCWAISQCNGVIMALFFIYMWCALLLFFKLLGVFISEYWKHKNLKNIKHQFKNKEANLLKLLFVAPAVLMALSIIISHVSS